VVGEFGFFAGFEKVLGVGIGAIKPGNRVAHSAGRKTRSGNAAFFVRFNASVLFMSVGNWKLHAGLALAIITSGM